MIRRVLGRVDDGLPCRLEVLMKSISLKEDSGLSVDRGYYILDCFSHINSSYRPATKADIDSLVDETVSYARYKGRLTYKLMQEFLSVKPTFTLEEYLKDFTLQRGVDLFLSEVMVGSNKVYLRSIYNGKGFCLWIPV